MLENCALILCLIALFYGGAVFCMGWTKTPKNGSFLGCGAIGLVVVFITAIATPSRDNPNGAPGAIILGTILIIVSIVWLVISIKGEKAAVQREVEEERIAAKQELKKQIELASKQKSLAYMFGEDKRNKMIRDKDKERMEMAKTMKELAFAVDPLAYQEKEHNWATWGGIAEGIAGPAAGIATAVQTMEENAQIRARNAATKVQMEQLRSDLIKQSITLQYSSGKTRQCRVIDWWSPKSLFNDLSIDTQSISIDPVTKSVKISVYVYPPAYTIDGAIRAKLYTNEGKYAGCAYLVFPENGTLLEGDGEYSRKRKMVSGICAEPIYKKNTYTVKFEPVNLWELFWEDKKKLPDKRPGLRKVTPEGREKILKKIEADFQKEEKEAMAQAYI